MNRWLHSPLVAALLLCAVPVALAVETPPAPAPARDFQLPPTDRIAFGNGLLTPALICAFSTLFRKQSVS